MPQYTILLPVLHADQIKAYHTPGPRKVVRCGRRWGKSVLAETIACDAAAKGHPVGYFTPEYKYQSEIFNDIASILQPIKASSSKIDGVIRTKTNGRVDFWTLENENAGRSRKYKVAIIDEAAFGKASTMATWERSIEPTLLDYGGTAWVFSNTNGADPENFLWRICNEAKHGFREYHAPTHNNPDMPARQPGEDLGAYSKRREAVYAKLKAEKHPLVYQQEYLAEFVDWSGVAFFELAKLLQDGKPVPYPTTCEGVVAIIDTAVKTGSANDGPGVSYWAYDNVLQAPIVCLDWDLIQIEGASLEVWIPSVFARLEELAKLCRARRGSQGAWIEDAQSGTILLQQCANRGLPAQSLPAALTSAGKDARGINASSPVYQGRVKFSQYAFEKTTTFKEVTRNHMVSQVVGFRVGDKLAAKRADDLLDTFTYAVAICLGDPEGIS